MHSPTKTPEDREVADAQETPSHQETKESEAIPNPAETATPTETASPGKTEESSETTEAIPKPDIREAVATAKRSKPADEREFLRVFFETITNRKISELGAESETLLEARDKLAEENLPEESIYSDPDFLKHYWNLIGRLKRQRITTGIGTKATRAGEFPECVAIGGGEVGASDEFFCTGTIIARNLVLTAAHCIPDQPQRVFIGDKTSTGGKRINIRGEPILFKYDQNSFLNDVALLILDTDAPVRPASIASSEAYEIMESVRVVGFGFAENQARVDTKRLTDVPVASRDGSRPRDRIYGCHPPNEFVAADPHRVRDSCKGDSGGPAYTLVNGKWKLVGITSRSTSQQGKCGDGGIYIRVDKYLPEIREKARTYGIDLD